MIARRMEVGSLLAHLWLLRRLINPYPFSVPTCFKRATIVPVPNKAKVTELNHYRP
jgi:hypothetical protein